MKQIKLVLNEIFLKEWLMKGLKNMFWGRFFWIFLGIENNGDFFPSITNQSKIKYISHYIYLLYNLLFTNFKIIFFSTRVKLSF